MTITMEQTTPGQTAAPTSTVATLDAPSYLGNINGDAVYVTATTTNDLWLQTASPDGTQTSMLLSDRGSGSVPDTPGNLVIPPTAAGGHQYDPSGYTWVYDAARRTWILYNPGTVVQLPRSTNGPYVGWDEGGRTIYVPRTTAPVAPAPMIPKLPPALPITPNPTTPPATEVRVGDIVIKINGNNNTVTVVVPPPGGGTNPGGGQGTPNPVITPPKPTLPPGLPNPIVIVEMTLPDGTIQKRYPDGKITETKPDGTVLTWDKDGSFTLKLPAGTPAPTPTSPPPTIPTPP